MKVRTSIYLLAILCLFGLNGFAKEGYNFMMLESATADSVKVCLLTTSTVLKFDGDTIKVTDGHEIRNLDGQKFSNARISRECLSPITMEVTTDSVGGPALGDIYVYLTGEGVDYMALVQQSNEEGIAVFNNIPYGSYTATCYDPEGDFFTKTVKNIRHEYNDKATLILDENVRLPIDVEYEVTKRDNSLYSIEIEWRMGEEKLYGPYKDYIFDIYVNDVWAGMTSETNFTLEDIQPGDYRIGISSLSWYGHQSEGTTDILICIVPEQTSGMETISQEEIEFQYYDLNGNIINPKSISPGSIYIVKDSEGKAKKIIR